MIYRVGSKVKRSPLLSLQFVSTCKVYTNTHRIPMYSFVFNANMSFCKCKNDLIMIVKILACTATSFVNFHTDRVDRSHLGRPIFCSYACVTSSGGMK